MSFFWVKKKKKKRESIIHKNLNLFGSLSTPNLFFLVNHNSSRAHQRTSLNIQLRPEIQHRPQFPSQLCSIKQFLWINYDKFFPSQLNINITFSFILFSFLFLFLFFYYFFKAKQMFEKYWEFHASSQLIIIIINRERFIFQQIYRCN